MNSKWNPLRAYLPSFYDRFWHNMIAAYDDFGGNAPLVLNEGLIYQKHENAAVRPSRIHLQPFCVRNSSVCLVGVYVFPLHPFSYPDVVTVGLSRDIDVPVLGISGRTIQRNAVFLKAFYGCRRNVFPVFHRKLTRRYSRALSTTLRGFLLHRIPRALAFYVLSFLRPTV